MEDVHFGHLMPTTTRTLSTHASFLRHLLTNSYIAFA